MKCIGLSFLCYLKLSPSMRREWIEIQFLLCLADRLRSPSMRREWIEILPAALPPQAGLSPSMRREWIEMPTTGNVVKVSGCLPPCGGSGLKYRNIKKCLSRHIVSLHAEGVD